MKTGRSSSRGKDDGKAKSGILREGHESPRHSASVTGALSSSFNGDIPGGGGVQVEVQRGGRTTQVDNIELSSMEHRTHTTSLSDDYISGGASMMSAPGSIGVVDSNHSNSKQRSVSTSHSRELNGGAGAAAAAAAATNGSSSAAGGSSSSHSLNTHL